MSSQGQYTTNKVVLAIGGIHFEGHLIPHEWYEYLKTGNGTPYLNAMHILADVIYWYRPVTVIDEHTGKLLGYRQKFKADKLQRSYDYYVNRMGFTKGQVKSAVDYLVREGYLTREFRTIIVNDVKLANVMFLEPAAEAIRRIGTPQPVESPEEACAQPNEVTPPGEPDHTDVGQGSDTPVGHDARGTNTKTSTESLVEDKDSSIHTQGGANAPVGGDSHEPAKRATKKKKTLAELAEERRQEALALAVIDHFKAVTKIDPPPIDPNANQKDKSKHYGMIGALWKKPAMELCRWAGYDLERSKRLVDDTITQMRSTGGFIASPKSLLTVANSLRGKYEQQQQICKRTRLDGGARMMPVGGK